MPTITSRGPRRARLRHRLTAASLAATVLLQAAAHAAHVDDGAYPYVAEVTIALTAQDKFYLVDPENPLTFHESTTTRMAGYRFWGSGLVGTQNDPPHGGPHGPLRALGLLVHEMGANRDGPSTIELYPASGSPHLRLKQDTILVHRDGTRTPELTFAVDLPIELRDAGLEAFSEPGRIDANLTAEGDKIFAAALTALVERVLKERRPEMVESLADNGLRIIEGSERFSLEFPGKRGIRMVFDTQIGAARLRLPDMLLKMTANLEQSYTTDEGNER